ncbi:uncharacterized protein LOC121656137 [Melanotaenia boesemani]|uniref:uncharacterized protein LOC121656137 n=1 Tax=Melanotaenia boesemani TaxID=1250792 RepID=UPI001C04346F|nr:uncharacterized protein LOC121656137 [Melanotaenia boesemani]
MSDSEDPLRSLDDLVDQYGLHDHLYSLGDLTGEVEEGAAAVSAPPPEPRVRWRKRNSDGKVLSLRPRSSRNQSNQAVHSRKTDPPFSAPHSTSEVAFAPETVECFLRDLQRSLNDAGDEQETSRPPLQSSSNWSTRKSVLLESWRAERHRLVDTVVLQEYVAAHTCQQCGINPADVRCCDHGHSSVLNVTLTCTPDTSFITEKQ